MSYGIELPRIENEDVFEILCLELIRMDDAYENARYGTKGQRQFGVDILESDGKTIDYVLDRRKTLIRLPRTICK